MRTMTLACLLLVAPAALATPAHQLSHRVKAGETLSQIAVKYETTTEALRAANQLPSDLIRSGEVLVVPWPAELREQSDEVRVVTHEVVPTESLGSLAERYHTTPLAIRVYNKLPSDVIKIGQKLQIPVTGAVPKRLRKTYEIDGGDSLRTIAEAHGLGTHVLRWLNPTVDWRNLREGQKIAVFVDTLEDAAPPKAAKSEDPAQKAAPAAGAKAPATKPAPVKAAAADEDAPPVKIRPGPTAKKPLLDDDEEAPEVPDDEE